VRISVRPVQTAAGRTGSGPGISDAFRPPGRLRDLLLDHCRRRVIWLITFLYGRNHRTERPVDGGGDMGGVRRGGGVVRGGGAGSIGGGPVEGAGSIGGGPVAGAGSIGGGPVAGGG